MGNYNLEEKQIILETVNAAIKLGLENNQTLKINLGEFPEKLCANGASFVTLEINKQLRGCIGSLEAHQPLIQDIVQNAFSAAFSDSRFSPLTKNEYPKITKHISVLSKPEPMSFTSEENLLKQLKPGIDGLILSELNNHATFLPSVWEALPQPELFLNQLKLKAGLSENHWSKTIQIERYTTEIIE